MRRSIVCLSLVSSIVFLSAAIAEQITFEVEGNVSIYDDFESPLLPDIEGGDQCSATFTYELDTPRDTTSSNCCSYSHFPPVANNNELILQVGQYQFMTSTSAQYNVNVNNDRDVGNGFFIDSFDVNGLKSVSPNFSSDYYVSVNLNMQSELNSLDALTSDDLPIAFDINDFDLPSTFVDLGIDHEFDDPSVALRCHIQSIKKVTEGNTDSGTNVLVAPPATNASGNSTGTSPVSFAFDEVDTAGITTVEISNTGPDVPAGFQLGSPAVYLNLDSSATFNGDVEVCIDYNEVGFNSPADLILLHYTGGAWEDITSIVDVADEQICGYTDSFSPFIVVKSEPPPLQKSLSLNIQVRNLSGNSVIASLGDTLKYTITAENTGDLTLKKVEVKSDLLRTSRKVCGSLSPGKRCIHSGKYVVAVAHQSRGYIQHLASTRSSTLESIRETHRIGVKSNPRLSIDHVYVPDNSSVYEGDSISYSLVAKNTGDVSLTEVKVKDRNLSPSQAVCNDLAVGETCTLSGIYTVTKLDADRGRLSNLGNVKSTRTKQIDKRLIVGVSSRVITPINPVAANNTGDDCNDGEGDVSSAQSTCATDSPQTPEGTLQSANDPARICLDSDGDGWGWDGSASCRMENSVAQPEVNTDFPPLCTSAVVTIDDQGWGWENNATCIEAGSPAEAIARQ